MKKIIKLLIIIILIFFLINIVIILTTNKKILTINKINDKKYDCILVLGAGVRNNYPSPMLEDRLKTAIELYNNKVAPKILVSGDHEYKNYDEVNVMKNYLIEAGIPSNDIFMDHAGLSTYDSIYRAKHIFKVKKMAIVTQKYHLYRSLYIANTLDINSIGISANKRPYAYQTKRDIREIAARIKDFFKCIIKPSPSYLGEVIPINGDGNITNDELEEPKE